MLIRWCVHIARSLCSTHFHDFSSCIITWFIASPKFALFVMRYCPSSGFKPNRLTVSMSILCCWHESLECKGSVLICSLLSSLNDTPPIRLGNSAPFFTAPGTAFSLESAAMKYFASFPPAMIMLVICPVHYSSFSSLYLITPFIARPKLGQFVMRFLRKYLLNSSSPSRIIIDFFQAL